MPKKNKKQKRGPIGRTLVKQMYSKKPRPQKNSEFKFVHSTETVSRGEKAARNLESIIEQNDLEQFFQAAQAQARDFAATHKSNIVLTSTARAIETVYDPTVDQPFLHTKLPIPTRPEWNRNQTKAQIRENEGNVYLNWRRELADIEKETKYTMAPFEKNILVWQQLWRVVEKSHVIVQIVDVREPLFYFSQALHEYCGTFSLSSTDTSGFNEQLLVPEEKDGPKSTIVMLNKCDLVPEEVSAAIENYFRSKGVETIRYSAKDETGMYKDMFLNFVDNKRVEYELEKIHIGFVGFPNVGKSSVINNLYGEKVVAISAQPGKTKHFQSGVFTDVIRFYDCPGLVFPKLTLNKSYLVLYGVLSADKVRDYRSPCELITHLVEKSELERIYHITIEEDGHGPLLMAIAVSHSWFSHGAKPNEGKAARVVMKDWNSGIIPHWTIPQ
ncbi:hypothetical protein PCE1_003452 [Barthelona sp. PCE]